VESWNVCQSATAEDGGTASRGRVGRGEGEGDEASVATLAMPCHAMPPVTRSMYGRIYRYETSPFLCRCCSVWQDSLQRAKSYRPGRASAASALLCSPSGG
jgi:hypothetical protein